MGKDQQLKAYLALVAVYFFWGTTYLGIRMALESFPPFLLVSSRFLVSGTIILIAAKLLRANLPKGRELWLTSLYGVVTLGGGNSCLVFAEQWIPSGTAALFITTSPFWMVGLAAALPGGERLHAPTLGGIVIGFLGVLALFLPGAGSSGANSALLGGFLLLQFGCLCWCLGSLLQRRQPTQAHPVVSGGIQQLAAGLAFLPAALIVPEHPVNHSTRGWLAFAWLVFFGSIVAYSAFAYCMEHLPVPIVSTYTYVNPLVAVSLGSLFYREPFGSREIFAMLTVFTGVAVVKYFSARQPQRQEVRA